MGNYRDAIFPVSLHEILKKNFTVGYSPLLKFHQSLSNRHFHLQVIITQFYLPGYPKQKQTNMPKHIFF